MNQDHEPDDVEKLVHAIGLIGEAFAGHEGNHYCGCGVHWNDSA